MKSRSVPPNRNIQKDTHVTTHDGAVTWRAFIVLWLVPLSLLVSPPSMAEGLELGRLFYTPAQRAQLETARARNVTQRVSSNNQDTPPAPQRYDGVVIRSDGQSTRWVDGKAEVGASSVKGLKPGQTRANGKVYEPYQVLRPSPSEPVVKGNTP